VLEELDIRLSEKESLLKSFLLFFIVIEVFLAFIFYNYYKIEEEHLSEEIFLELKNYSFFFNDDRFDVDIVSNDDTKKPYELYFDDNSLYILAPFEQDSKDYLKIFYPKISYQKELKDTQHSIYKQFAFLTLIASIISLLFSFYALSPLRNALLMLEEFIKDIIHDLNTPITSILINLGMMDKNSEEVQSISQSAKTISMLHKNLDSYLKDMHFKNERFRVDIMIKDQISFFSSLYDHLEWKVDLEELEIDSDKNALTRVVYNLLSNACKYNIKDGFVHITLKDKILSITNSSHGIKNPKKIFDRFYKESDRGMGIGLHIVKKLLQELEIKKELKVDKDIVTITLYLVTSK
jgi:two-component system OmpR family sensor kinase